MSDSIWMALALVMILEGLLPFASPSGWRKMFTALLAMQDGQIRFMGLLAILVGVVGLLLLS
jgi:hypothetical protein